MHYIEYNLCFILLIQGTSARCREFRDCVQCQVHKTGPLDEKDCAETCKFEPQIVADLSEGKRELK